MRLTKLLFVFLLVALVGKAQDEPSPTGWYDESKTTHTIETAAQLADLAKRVNGTDIYEGSAKKFEGHTILLGNDIDLTTWLGTTGNDNSNGWRPIGTSQSNPFNGIFDGQQHRIEGLWINREEINYIGLFGYIDSSAEIKNLTVTIDNTNAGDDSSIKKGVKGNYFVGGLVGMNMNATITDCSVLPINRDKLMITGVTQVGGLAGSLNNCTITNCYATGAVKGTKQYVGGLIGRLDNNDNSSAFMNNCYATGTVEGIDDAGGLAGSLYSSTITNCYATGAVKGTGQYAGGLIGNLSSSIITNCYATGAVDGNKNVGGLAGLTLMNNITHCYAAGAVEGNENVGGMAGTTIMSTFTASFYNSDNIDLDVGSAIGDHTVVLGISSIDMKTIAYYTAESLENNVWDFSAIWAIDATGTFNGGYPYLRWQAPTVTLTITPTDNFAYSVGGITEVKADKNMFAVTDQTTPFSFSITAKAGYTTANAVVKAVGNDVPLTVSGGSYSLVITRDTTITVTGIEASQQTDPQPVITYHTLTLSVGEGIMTDKTKKSFQIESGNPFSFVITLAEGYVGETPTVMVNGKTKGLISIGTDKWRCILSEIYEDTNVAIGFNFTGNDTPDAPRLYSRGGQFFVETPVATTIAVYSMTGQTVVSRSLPEGLTSFPLAKGIYIVKLGKRVEKVTVTDN